MTTDRETEVEYLDDLPACTNRAGDEMYLENNSDAVWALLSKSGRAGVATPIEQDDKELSFIDAVQPTGAILVPGAKASIDLRPEDVEWRISLPMSFGWQAHDLVVAKIEDVGEAAAVKAMKRQSRAGGAVAAGTLAVKKYADTYTAGLENADAKEVMVDGFGAGVSGVLCGVDAASVALVDQAGNPETLADELEHLRNQTEILEKVHVRMDYAQRAAKALALGLQFLRR